MSFQIGSAFIDEYRQSNDNRSMRYLKNVTSGPFPPFEPPKKRWGGPRMPSTKAGYSDLPIQFHKRPKVFIIYGNRRISLSISMACRGRYDAPVSRAFCARFNPLSKRDSASTADLGRYRIS
jgi:hypothetical protein